MDDSRFSPGTAHKESPHSGSILHLSSLKSVRPGILTAMGQCGYIDDVGASLARHDAVGSLHGCCCFMHLLHTAFDDAAVALSISTP